MLRDTLFEQMKMAMKAREAERLSVLRYLLSEIKNVEIDAKHELGDEEVIQLLRKEVKRRKEAIEQYVTAGRDDIVTKEKRELTVIESFLPKMMDREAVEAVVESVVAELGGADFGMVMKAAMQKLQGQADGKLVSELVRSKIL